MNDGATRLGVLASTGGAVLSRLLASPWFRRHIVLVASDRDCGALDHAREAGVAIARCASGEPEGDETELANAFAEHEVDHVLVFHTRLLRYALLARFRGRLWNLHPSLLPAFPGRHGFRDGFRSGTRVIGTTIHAIDEGCDTGPILCQTTYALADGALEASARHAIFCQQVRTALQACRWLAAGRVRHEAGRVTLEAAPVPQLLAGTLYSPGLDDREAGTMSIPDPNLTRGVR